MKKYIGLDIGGTTVKGIILDENGTPYDLDGAPTNWEFGGEAMCRNIQVLTERMIADSNVAREDIVGVGVGCPGMIDSERGVVIFAGNLKLEKFPLVRVLKKKLGFENVRVTNDANAAALGEARFGAGRNYKNSILVTLGTGVGGGIIIDGKLFEGFKSAGAEMGHMVIEDGGNLCTCGRRGCFEAYCSATALIKKTREAMRENPYSQMWWKYDLRSANGKTAFDFLADEAAKGVVDWYLHYLACGLTNLANIFRPQIIMLGGGVSEQGKKLTIPLQKLVDEQIFAGTGYAPVRIAKATLGSRAGAFGAAALVMD